MMSTSHIRGENIMGEKETLVLWKWSPRLFYMKNISVPL
jgi:hypothetical protein